MKTSLSAHGLIRSILGALLLFAVLLSARTLPAEITWQENTHVLADFRFQGNTQDSSGHNRHAKLIGGSFVAGGGLRVSAGPAGIDWSEYAALLRHPYTIEMVLVPSSTTPWGKLFSFRDDRDGGWYYKNNGLQVYPSAVVGAGKIQPGTRHYLAFVSLPGNRAQMYYQGRLLGETDTHFTEPPTEAIFFYDDSATSRREQLDAVIVGLRISSAPLTADELAAQEKQIAYAMDADVSQLRFVDARHQEITRPLMLGEPFLVEAKFNTRPTTTREVELTWGDSRKLSLPLIEDPQWAEVERPLHHTDRVILAEGPGGGAMTAKAGETVQAWLGGRSATLNLAKPQIRIAIVSPGLSDRSAAVDSITAYEAFRVEVSVPRELAASIGDSLSVTLRSELADDSSSLTLRSRQNPWGFVTYTNDDAVTLAKGAALGHIAIFPLWTMVPVKTRNGDTLTINYKDTEIKTTVYDHAEQQAIAMYRRGFESIRDFLARATAAPGLAPADHAILHAKLELVKNALAIIAHRRSDTDDTWSDYKCLRIAEEYSRLLEMDSRSWSPVTGAEEFNRRFGIVVLSAEERNAIQEGFDRAYDDHLRALHQGIWAVAEGTYQVITNVTGVNQLHTAIFGIDNMGNRVDVTNRVLAGIQVASMVVLIGARASAGPAAELAAEGKGINAFAMRSLPTRVRRAGIGGEEYLLDVYGGSSEVDFASAVGGRRYDSFSKSGMIGRESKVGSMSLNQDLRRELATDIELLRTGAVRRVEWHFFANEAGVLHITAPLREALQKAGIVIVERPDLLMR